MLIDEHTYSKMGAGQIGGFATLLDLDFNNAAGFIGHQVPSDSAHPNYLVYFLSHAMMFCVGTVIEAHVILTPAICVYGERYKFEVYGATHKFLERTGLSRRVEHFSIHKHFNKSSCLSHNIGVLLLEKQFLLSKYEENTPAEFVVGRVRYGLVPAAIPENGIKCEIFGWGSRRNGYLVPLLIYLMKVELTIMPHRFCDRMWNCNKQFLCIQQLPCKDDLGTAIVCGGYIKGMMVSRLVDRPCGVGYLDISKYNKFMTCAVDDSQEIVQDSIGIIDHNNIDISGMVKSVTLYKDDEDDIVDVTPVPTVNLIRGAQG